MKALISPNETTTAGARVVDLQVTSYPVAPPLFWLDCDNTVTTNYFWSVNSGFVLPEPEVPVVLPVTTITRRQFFRALHTSNLLQSVLAIIETADTISKLDFENATTFERADPVLIAMAYALGKTDNDIDALFTLAATY